ncbi:unnamed protein product [Didymodactylos carnosus]|uniref:SEC7 domain-containing protein n=1 Tax=Didymodactylos carnosus TaxID=1234261 RepID=A0A815NGV9_9BILA|nr:unnamed protein product [Didymodactylos carnosus]CAF4310316.1 unnamed protein product [Didymodactylos carnosus]
MSVNYEAVSQREELFKKGCDIFNQDPKKGLQFLIDNNLVHQEAEDVAQFFHSYQDVLDKTVIGDFLAENTKYHKEVMNVYFDQLDFNKMDFLAAFRKFLAGCHLPREATKIDRLMEKFAARYCECNSNLGIFASDDAAYVKKKRTKEDFIKMNRGINDGRDLPEEFLSKIYDEIENEEIKL